MALRLKSPTEVLPPFSFSPPPSPDSSSDARSPQTVLLPASEMNVFGLHPLNPEVGNVTCSHCKKPVLKAAIAEHSANCKKIREGGAIKPSSQVPMASSTTTASTTNAAATTAADDKKNGKKRKAGEMEGEDANTQPVAAKKRAKPTPRITKGRVKAPVDVDRQCGVINDKGLPCSRSLTCKSHAMGAKRAVEGRSKGYDELLLEWNRAHKPNFVEPVKRQTKEEKRQQKEKEKAEKAAQKQAEKESALAAALAAGEKPKKSGGGKKKPKVDFMVDVPIEEDESMKMNEMEQQLEVDRLVNAVRTMRQNGYGPTPMAVPADARLYFLKSREFKIASYEPLSQALTGW